METQRSLRYFQQILWTICLSVGLLAVVLTPTLYAADQDNGHRHSLLHRPTTGTVPPLSSTQGVIVSGSDAQPPPVQNSVARPQNPSPSTPPTPSPHHKLTKRPGVAAVTPVPSSSATQPLTANQKAGVQSTAASTATSNASSGLGEGPVVKPSSTLPGVMSATATPPTAATRLSSSSLANSSTMSSSSVVNASSGTATAPVITGSRSAANLLQNPAITSLLQPPAPTVTSPPPSSPPAPAPAPPPPPSSSTPPPPSSAIGSATLLWNANSDSDLVGYKVYVGTQSGLYTFPGSPFTIGTVTSYTILNLPAGQTYFFALSAYDTYGNESPLSNEVSKSIY